MRNIEKLAKDNPEHIAKVVTLSTECPYKSKTCSECMFYDEEVANQEDSDAGCNLQKMYDWLISDTKESKDNKVNENLLDTELS